MAFFLPTFAKFVKIHGLLFFQSLYFLFSSNQSFFMYFFVRFIFLLSEHLFTSHFFFYYRIIWLLDLNLLLLCHWCSFDAFWYFGFWCSKSERFFTVLLMCRLCPLTWFWIFQRVIFLLLSAAVFINCCYDVSKNKPLFLRLISLSVIFTFAVTDCYRIARIFTFCRYWNIWFDRVCVG